MKKEVHIVRQGVATLPFLDDEVPALYTADNKPYIPAFAVCRVLGLPVDPHIRKWRNMLLWVTAHKLPLKTERGMRNVWCLLISEVPFLYANVIWRYVSSERRAQLHEAIEKGMDLANAAYQQMQREYHEFRQTLFTFLRTCADLESQWGPQLHGVSDEIQQKYRMLLQEGQSLYHDAAALARAILQEQGTNPVIDALILNNENSVVDSFAMPLLPVIDREKKSQFLVFIAAIGNWHLAMAHFLRTCQ